MSPTTVPGVIVSNFFTSLYSHKPPESWILVWTLPEKRSYWCSSIAQCENVIDQTFRTSNIYVQLALSPKNYGVTQRCKAEDTLGIVGLHIDLDYGERGHKKGNLPPTEEKAYELLTSSPLPPTMVVNSGGGLWGHWLLDEPWIFADNEDRLKAAKLAENWNRYFAHLGAVLAKEDGCDAPYSVDMTFDLARVARIPGTWNNKAGYDPVLATIVEQHNNYRYSKAELIRTVDALEWPETPVFAQKHTNGHVKTPVTLAPVKDADSARIREFAATLNIQETSKSAVQLPDKWQALCDNNIAALDAWEGKREGSNFLGIPVDNSTSGIQFALALHAAWADWTAQEIYDLILAYNVKSNPTNIKSHETLKYTVAKALLRVLDERLRRQDAPPVPVVTVEERVAILKELTTLLGIQILSFKATVSSPRHYSLQTVAGNTESVTISALQSGERVQGLVADATNILIPLYNKAKWQNILRKLLLVVEDENIGVENTLHGSISGYLRAYLESHAPSSEEDAPGTQVVLSAKMRGDPFYDGESICIFLQELKLFIQQKYQERVTPPQLGQFLRAYGAVPVEEKNVHLPNTKKRSNFNFWRLPDDPREAKESEE